MILLQSGLVKTSDYKTADLIILNTCSVRKKWEDRVFSMLKEVEELNKINQKQIIVWVTGCMVRKTGMNKKYLSQVIEKNKATEIDNLYCEKSQTGVSLNFKPTAEN